MPDEKSPGEESGDDAPGIVMTSGVNVQGKPFVHYTWRDGPEDLHPKKTQWSPAEARAHALGLLHAAEAAEHDGAVYDFLREKLNVSDEVASCMLRDMRNFRRPVG